MCPGIGGIDYCASFTSITTWSNHPDALIGVAYPYCLTGENCGSDKCKGNGDNSLICSYSQILTNFTCVPNLNVIDIITNTQWWTSPWFIGLAVGLGVVGLIVFIIILVIISRINRSSES